MFFILPIAPPLINWAFDFRATGFKIDERLFWRTIPGLATAETVPVRVVLDGGALIEPQPVTDGETAGGHRQMVIASSNEH